MDIILVPGLWLDASSWDAVVPALAAAGHRPVPMTLPGVGEPASSSEAIGMTDWVAAVVAEIDAIDGPVVLVGHSGGGNVVWGAASERPDRVTRVVLVDTVPPPPDSAIAEFDTVDGVVPFPGWDFFPEADVSDLDAQTRERALARTASIPSRVPTDPIHLSGEQHRVPVTMLMGTMERSDVERELAQWAAYDDEYRAIDDVTVTTIGSGHWPQFSRPERLAALIDASVPHAQSPVHRDDRA